MERCCIKFSTPCFLIYTKSRGLLFTGFHPNIYFLELFISQNDLLPGTNRRIYNASVIVQCLRCRIFAELRHGFPGEGTFGGNGSVA